MISKSGNVIMINNNGERKCEKKLGVVLEGGGDK